MLRFSLKCQRLSHYIFYKKKLEKLNKKDHIEKTNINHPNPLLSSIKNISLNYKSNSLIT